MDKLEFEFRCMKIPSVNSTYHRGANGVFKDPAVKEYQNDLSSFAFYTCKNKNRIFCSDLEVKLIFKIKNNNRDLDNMIKATLDAFQGVLFKNDFQVMKLECYKQQTKDKFEYVKVEIKEFKTNRKGFK